MKYYIGRVVINDHESRREYHSDACIAANDEAQAQSLLDTRAAFWGGDDARKDNSGGYVFDEDGAAFTVFAYSLKEISPATFDEMANILPVIGDVAKAPVTGADLPEVVKTVARRIGDQLAKRKVAVSSVSVLEALSASLGAKNWAELKARVSKPQLPAEDSLPRGNPYKGPLRDAKDIEFSARVDALWLTDGDVALAAQLLRTEPESLMQSFVDAMDADVAFCSRPANWSPEHSLARDFGIKADIAHLGYKVRVEHNYPGSAQVTALTPDGNEVIVLNNHVSGRWTVASVTALVGRDSVETNRALACQEEALRRVFELQHSGY